MDIVSGLVVYILLWWWVFFMTLPFGARPPEQAEKGHAPSAPEKPYIVRKMLITTAIAGVLFLIVHQIITSGIIDFRQ